MATELQINAVVDAVIAAFDSDPALWSAFLVRSKLETEIAALESAERNLRAEYNAETTAYNDELAENQAAQAALQAEIDAL
jgi:peptidoglycan hydrolase CwlO-like protein